MHDIENGKVDYPQLLHQTYQEALVRNEQAHTHWQKLREEYKLLESLLNELPKELTKDVMIPVAPRALMRGKIIHTNEILVCLGQGYFVKRSATQAAAICKRREKICCDMLQSLEKERELFIGRQELPLQEDAFSGSREIIEVYNEEEEAHWRAEHEQKEREYRQKLTKLRTKEKTAVIDEESLWRRLDELELQEELEEELDRLHAEDNEEEDDEEKEGMDDDDDDDEEEEEIDGKFGSGQIQRASEAPGSGDSQASHSSLHRRVSFANIEGEESAEEELRITFCHSNVLASEPASDQAGVEAIQSPAELYFHFKNQFIARPKSILKKTSSYDNVLGEAINQDSEDELSVYESACDIPSQLPPPVLEEVVERDMMVSGMLPTVDRPVSRFKALRQQKKR